MIILGKTGVLEVWYDSPGSGSQVFPISGFRLVATLHPCTINRTPRDRSQGPVSWEMSLFVTQNFTHLTNPAPNPTLYFKSSWKNPSYLLIEFELWKLFKSIVKNSCIFAYVAMNIDVMSILLITFLWLSSPIPWLMRVTGWGVTHVTHFKSHLYRGAEHQNIPTWN